MSRESVLVTGASGFVGRHILSALSADFDVTSLVRSIPADLPCKRIVLGDLRDDRAIQEALKGIDIVCHAAAYIPGLSDDLPESAVCYEVNAHASLRLAEAAKRHGARRFVFLSTGNMYASSEHPCGEDAAIYPPKRFVGYFASKLAAELYIRQVYIESVILRIGTPYGPGESSTKVIPTFLNRAARCEAIRIAGDGSARFNFVFIDDVADCVRRSIRGSEVGIYNVSSGEHTSIFQLAQAVSDIFPAPIEFVSSTCPDRGFSPMSIERAKSTFGFAPRSLERGLRDYARCLGLK